MAEGDDMDIGKCFKDAWGLFKLDLGPLLVTALIASVIVGVASAVLFAVMAGGIGLMRFGGAAGGILGSASAFFAFILVFVVGLLAYAWAAATMFRMIVLRVRERRPATFADMKETDEIGAVAVAFVILGVLIGIGYALLVIPGLILVTLWIYALPLVVDRRLSVGEAMSESRRLAAAPGYFITFLTWLVGSLVVGIIVSVLNVIPVVGLIVGLLAVPFELAYVLSMYFQATGEGHLIDAAIGQAPASPGAGG
ncbi:MAG: hypothetical protein NTW58_02885 [Actinobacteria bacterium]|nr:hypothetical protein [Actinomycetota bacterium]